MDEEEKEIIEIILKELIENQQDIPQEFVDVINDNFWDLVD